MRHRNAAVEDGRAFHARNVAASSSAIGDADDSLERVLRFEGAPRRVASQSVRVAWMETFGCHPTRVSTAVGARGSASGARTG